jgi:broad specificity phosphatase PhoE
VDRVIARSRAVDGDIALFAHGHVLRVLAARWIGLPAGGGQHFLLDTGTLVSSATTARYRLCGSGMGLSSARAR